MMTRETLYDAITEVKDELIIEAIETKPAKSRVRWLKFGSIAAAAALVAGLGAGVFSGKIPVLPIGGNASGGSGHNEGSSVFMSYAGPVFPLTTVEGGGGLTAEREITYDFQDWDAFDGLPTRDTYTLTNSTGEDKTVTLLYPFVDNFFALNECESCPILTVDGEKLNTELYAGQYAGGFGNGIFADQPGSSNLRRPESWYDYKTLLSDGSYQASALEDWPDLSGVPVTVYELTNPWVAEDAGGTNPTIHAAFELDYGKTTVLTYGFHGGCFDREAGTMRQGFSAPTPPADPDHLSDYDKWALSRSYYLIVIGQPLDNFELIGTHDGAPESTDYMEWGTEIGADMRKYDTDLESALRTVFDVRHEKNAWPGAVTPDMLFGAMKDCLLSYGLLSDDPATRYSSGWLEDLDCESVDRVFYLEAQVTVPAGGSVTVEASFVKDASYDFACTHTKNQGVYGYDLVTKLGTKLNFTDQTAAAVNTDGVEIVRQNFGFDWANGLNTVTLDRNEEHYYLEVRKK